MIIALVFLAALPAAADPISDLRTILQRYPGTMPFAVTASVQATGKSRDVAAARTGSARFEVESRGGGLLVRIPPEVLGASETESENKKRDADSATPTRTAMVALTIFDVIEPLDAAAMLRTDLDGATLIDRTPSSYRGQPATLLRLKVKPAIAGTRSRFVNEPVIELRLWLDSSGVPIAGERDSNYSASIAFATAANIRTERWEFSVAGDRLFASRADQEDRATAAGKSVVSARSLTYVPKGLR
jgi:hypothetical protein